ncbi:MAG TPA: hypothetical protein P5077_10840 [bacterium]|nr:hypothetical protein [bacterium]
MAKWKEVIGMFNSGIGLLGSHQWFWALVIVAVVVIVFVLRFNRVRVKSKRWEFEATCLPEDGKKREKYSAGK